MRLLRNRQALPVVSLAQHPPRPDIAPQTNGQVDTLLLEGNSFSAGLDAVRDGYVWVSVSPVRGWRWSVDGEQVELEQGPGIVQYSQVVKGRHMLVGEYRPPGLIPAAMTSVVAAIVTVLMLLVAVVEHQMRGEDVLPAKREHQMNEMRRAD